jgi:urease accessory protein
MAIMRIEPRSPARGEGEGGLLLLQAWLSPAFPVGGYSYSHGLEQAVEAGLVPDRAALLDWIDGVLTLGAGRNDALLIREIHAATLEGDMPRCAEIAALAAALRGTAELSLEAGAQGAAFLKALAAGWPDLAVRPPLSGMRTPTYAVVFGAAAALAGIPARAAILAYLQAFAANLISAALRLMPIGQSDGLALLARIGSTLPAQVDALETVPFADLGSAALMVDLCSARHETQYTRLFRS